ncbi:dihydroneopterin aldolase [Collinsella sp. zg1085]|uniref:dihydroneopterin aldolase n=1 Tax=Collinsella sp. zg1085 TaxID=2844380 RepID=UPI001C0BEF43|nr:dihydroneopterin aldolase [Collinsella sp. zg1085]QWT18140.1 dihydroneopterin aldolase [Collinsella sp. zg1085]
MENQMKHHVSTQDTSTLAPYETHTALKPHMPQAQLTQIDIAHMDCVHIDGLEVFARHGVYSAEHELDQKFVISLTLYTNLQHAGITDELEYSIDYATTAQLIDCFVREHHFKLIESIAEGIAQRMFSHYPTVVGVRVRVDKPWAALGLPVRSCGVEIERVRQRAEQA